MAQKKTQGSLTIADFNDIESIIVEYARNQSTTDPPTSNWSTTRPTWAQGYYIWQRTRIHKTGTSASSDTFGDAVCLTGSTGNTGATGQSLTATKTQYTHVASNVTITTQNHTSYTWTDNVPEYDSTKPTYWGRITNTYTNPAKTEYIVYKDNGLTDAVDQAVEANANAAAALDKANESESIAQSANENANGAMSQAANGIKEIYRIWYRTNSGTAPSKPSSHVTNTSNDVNNTWTKVKPIENTDYRYYFYCEETVTNGGISSWTDPVLDTSNLSQYEITALETRTKNFFWPGDSNYPGAYVAGRNSSDSGFDSTDISTYYHNLRLTPTSVTIGYNHVPVINLKTTPSPSSLDFYQLPTINGTTVTQGKLTMSLKNSSLTFYDPSNGTTEQAVLDTSGLKLKKGGLEAGTKNSTDYIYVWSNDDATNHTLTINNHEASDWRIIAGNKFGVDKAGNLYASNAEISGKITASSLTVGTGATVSGLSTSNISGMDSYALQSSLDTEVNQRKATYAICPTTITQAAKATESGTPAGFILYNGVTVTIKFTYANSTSTPTLNVNGTGAKTIKSYTGAALTAAEYGWPAGAIITFTYVIDSNTGYWRMQDGGALQAKADAAASATAASNSATSASGSATAASNSATSASGSATVATNKASEASQSATTANNAKTTAQNAQTAAEAAKTAAQNAQTAAQNAQTSAEAAVDWTVGIEVTTIDYLNNRASLKATAYKTGVAQTTGVSYRWYRDSSELTGQTSATLSNVSLDYSYTCIIS